MKKIILFTALPALLFFSGGWKKDIAPGSVVDRVIAVVGDQVVKESELRDAYDQFKGAGVAMTDSLRGVVLDELIFKKLLINQAGHDSITVTESDITNETDRRMRYFLQQFKSDKDFEQFYGKTVDAFKFELHDQVRDLLLAQKMQSKITSDISVSPSDINDYFNSQPADSLPFINSQVEIGQIIIIPPVNADLKEATRQDLDALRTRILKKQIDFCAAAASYSKDPGSALKCGEYDNVRRGTFVPDFDAVVFSLKEGETSNVFETQFGFHIVQMLARRGEEVDIRHILFTIPTDPDDLRKCKVKLDSILTLIRNDSLTFCEAAAKFSDDKDSKFSCGLFLNPETGISKIDVDKLGQLDPDPQFPLTISQMKVGDFSRPQQTITHEGKDAYRILWLKSRTDPHRANLKQDYQLIQDLALQEKQDNAVQAWVRKRLATTYIRIIDDYKNYTFKYPWLEFMGKQNG